MSLFKISKTKLDLVFVYFAYSLRYVYLLLLIPFYSRVLGVEGYGVISAGFSLMQIIWLFVNWGFIISASREIAIANPNQYALIFGKYLSGMLMVGFAGLILGGVAVYFSTILRIHYLVGLLSIILGIVSAFNLSWYFTNTQRPRVPLVLEVLSLSINLVLILIFVNSPSDVWISLITLIFSNLVINSIALWLIRSEIKGVKVNFQGVFKLINKTKFLFLYASSSILIGASSTYLLSLTISTTGVGLFSAADRLVSAGLSLMGPLFIIFSPKVMVLFQSNKDNAYILIKKITFLLLTIAMIGTLLCLFAAEPIVNIIFGKHFSATAEILKYYAVIFPVYALNMVLGGYLFIALHHDNELVTITAFGLIIFFTLAILMVPVFGVYGMVLSRVVCELSILIALIFKAHHLGILQSFINANNIKTS